MSIQQLILNIIWLFQIIKKSKLSNKYNPVSLFFVDICNYNNWFKNEESVDTTRKNGKEESVDLSDYYC